MIKKLVYSYTLYFDNFKPKREYKLSSSKHYVYGDDKNPVGDEINFYETYYKATQKDPEDFYGYLFDSSDLGVLQEIHSECYYIYSFKPLTKDEIIEKFEFFMANKIKNTVLRLQSIYSDIRDSLEEKK